MAVLAVELLLGLALVDVGIEAGGFHVALARFAVLLIGLGSALSRLRVLTACFGGLNVSLGPRLVGLRAVDLRPTPDLPCLLTVRLALALAPLPSQQHKQRQQDQGDHDYRDDDPNIHTPSSFPLVTSYGVPTSEGW